MEIGELSCDAPPFTPEGAAAFLRAISEAAQDAVVMVDGAGRIAFWNRGAERIFGYAVAEVAGLHAHSLLAPARFRDRAEAALKAFASTGQGAAIGKTLELVGLRRDGVEIPVELSASSVMLGGQWYAVGILRDITGRKRAEEQLRVANAYLTSQIESAPDGVLIVDARTDKISFNRRYLDLWGFQPDVAATFDRTAVRAAMLALVRQPEQLLRAIEQSREQPDAPTNGELELKDGRTFEYDLTSMRDDQREFLAGICFFRDITARKRAAEELHNSQQLLEGILNAIPVRVFWKNKNLVYLGCNTIFARDAGFAEPKEIVGKDDYQLGWREQGDLYRRDDQSVIESGQSKFLIEEPQTTPDGKTIVLLTTKVPLRGPAGEIDGVLGAYMDITERKEAERRLQSANIILSTALETSLDAILVVDEQKRITSFNRRFLEMWNISSELIATGDYDRVLAAITSQVADPDGFLARMRHLWEHFNEASKGELVTTDGRVVTRYSAPMTGVDGRYLGRIWFFRDISDRKRAEARVLQMARFDSLTGLANRAVFVEKIGEAIARVRRGAAGFAVLYLDLDHFKDVNDTLGHPVGDKLLRAFGERMRKRLRETDAVARFGGDEFAVLVANITDPTTAGILATEILQIAAEPYEIDGNTIHSGASIGISTCGSGAVNAEALLSEADLALYRAKSEQRGTFRFFTADMDDDVRARVALSGELRNAIARNELILQYQPQVDVAGGRIVGLEALIRWNHPTRGILPPNKFIEIAEQSGQIGALTRWILAKTCRQVKEWSDAGMAPGSTAVNLSSLQLKAPAELERDINVALAEARLPASYLAVEVTETALMEACRQHDDLMQRLRRNGLKVVIDNFGIGYSSLAGLRRFPVDRLKIARDFVGRIADSQADAAIVRATISMARGLGIEVVAEGVETKEQLELLRRWGCEQVQGYLFSRPLSVDQITQLLQIGSLRPAA